MDRITKSKVGQADDATPVVMVGYPHGRQCYVTVGTYRCPSCRGNSGCLCVRIGSDVYAGVEDTVLTHPYSGVGADMSSSQEP